MKPKAQTMSQKFGFMDPDLATPQHDAIMLWLDETLTKVFADKTFDKFPDHQWLSLDDENAELTWMLKNGKIVVSPSVQVQAIIRKIWECPIVDKTFTIGFADMRLNYAKCGLSHRSAKEALAQGAQPPILIENSSPITWLTQSRYFEVKPSIPSLGEVIRQVRMYQTYTAGAEWWIVSPDARFREQIEAQGIKFLVVPSDI